jgi:hypothetical protein
MMVDLISQYFSRDDELGVMDDTRIPQYTLSPPFLRRYQGPNILRRSQEGLEEKPLIAKGRAWILGISIG